MHTNAKRGVALAVVLFILSVASVLAAFPGPGPSDTMCCGFGCPNAGITFWVCPTSYTCSEWFGPGYCQKNCPFGAEFLCPQPQGSDDFFGNCTHEPTAKDGYVCEDDVCVYKAVNQIIPTIPTDLIQYGYGPCCNDESASTNTAYWWGFKGCQGLGNVIYTYPCTNNDKSCNPGEQVAGNAYFRCYASAKNPVTYFNKSYSSYDCQSNLDTSNCSCVSTTTSTSTTSTTEPETTTTTNGETTTTTSPSTTTTAPTTTTTSPPTTTTTIPGTNKGEGEKCDANSYSVYGDCAECLFCDLALGDNSTWGKCAFNCTKLGEKCGKEFSCPDAEDDNCVGKIHICLPQNNDACSPQDDYDRTKIGEEEKNPDCAIVPVDAWDKEEGDKCTYSTGVTSKGCFNDCIGEKCGEINPNIWSQGNPYPDDAMCFIRALVCQASSNASGDVLACVQTEPPTLTNKPYDNAQGQVCNKYCDTEDGSLECPQQTKTTRAKVDWVTETCQGDAGCKYSSKTNCAVELGKDINCVWCAQGVGDDAGCRAKDNSEVYPDYCSCHRGPVGATTYWYCLVLCKSCGGTQTVCPGNSGYPLITTQLCDDAQDCVPDEEDGPPDGGEGAGGGAGDGPWIGAECGNSIVEFNEDCEQNVAFAASCTDFGFTGGTLQCTNCAWDTSLCTGAGPDGFCGDGIWQDLVEECEPGIPYPWTCEDLGYDDGITSCNAMCMVDGSLCYNMEDIYCGDGIIQPGEECDSQNFGDIECSDIDSFIGGVLQCGSDCLFYTELCQADCPGECGDDELNGEGEQCDGPDLGPVSSSCSDYPGADFGSGTITCNTDCTINLNNCRPGTCGDSILNSGEECDDGNKNDGDGCSAVCTAESCGNNIIDKGEQCESGVPYSLDCESLGFSGGGITCTNCKWNTSQCIDGSGTCGNNMVDSPGEVCDGSDLSGLECSDFTGYNSGSLSCNPDCSLNFSNCKYSRCRNGIIDPGESCEPDIALSLDCSDFGYFGGDVYCDPFTCQISTEYCDCVEGFCGDGTINSGQETCDGDDWGQIERCSQIGDFTGGSLSCGDDCSFDTTGCNFDNNCPVMQYVIITDPAYVSTAITAVSVGWTDLDADDVTPTYQYRWYRNGNLQYTSTDGASSVYTGAQQIGDLIEVRVRADDGECFGNEVSDSVTVQNMPPGVILTASPGVVTGCSGTVQLIATANDPDLGDTLAYRFDYESDGIWDTSFSTSNIISHSYSSYGQPELIYFATVEVSDGYSAVAASAQILVLCNSMNQACDQVQNLKAELDDDLQTINLSWTGGSLIDYYQICILGDMGSSTDLSSATRDFNCNYLGQGIFLPGSALNWQDTQAYLVPERYYKVRAICEYPGIGNQTNTSSKTVGKYEIPLYKPVMIPQNPVGLIKDKFSIPLNHTDMRIFKVLKSMGLGRGIDNAIWVSDYPSVCNQPDFSGNYSAAWQWDALAYLLAGKNQIEGFKLYRPGALCPYYQTEAFDLTDVKPGRYYEIELHEDEVLVNVGDVIISASVGLYTGIDVERKSPLGLTLPYDLGIQQALSDIGAGRGRNNSDYPTFPSCTGNSADNFIGNYSFVTTYDAPNGFVTYNPNMECPFYSAIDYIRDIMPGEGYLITMAENDTVTFNH